MDSSNNNFKTGDAPHSEGDTAIVAGTVYTVKRKGWHRQSPRPISKDKQRQIKNGRINKSRRNMVDVYNKLAQSQNANP